MFFNGLAKLGVRGTPVIYMAFKDSKFMAHRFSK